MHRLEMEAGGYIFLLDVFPQAAQLNGLPQQAEVAATEVCPAAAASFLPKVLQDPPRLVLEGGSAPPRLVTEGGTAASCGAGSKRGSRASIFGVLARHPDEACSRPAYVQNTPTVSLHSVPA